MIRLNACCITCTSDVHKLNRTLCIILSLDKRQNTSSTQYDMQKYSTRPMNKVCAFRWTPCSLGEYFTESLEKWTRFVFSHTIMSHMQLKLQLECDMGWYWFTSTAMSWISVNTATNITYGTYLHKHWWRYTLNNIGSLKRTLQYYYYATPGEPCKGSPGVAW